MEKRISLFDVFGNNIITRNSIADFFEEINSLKNYKIVLDFKKITFLSRSCADEYLKQKKASKKNILEVNVSNNLCEMFSLVNRQYQKEGINLLVQIIPECGTDSLIFA